MSRRRDDYDYEDDYEDERDEEARRRERQRRLTPWLIVGGVVGIALVVFLGIFLFAVLASPRDTTRLPGGLIQTPYGPGQRVVLQGKADAMAPGMLLIQTGDFSEEMCELDRNAPNRGPVNGRRVRVEAVRIVEGEHKGRVVMGRVVSP